MDNDLRQYLNSVRGYKRTTPAEERKLSKTIQAGRQAVKLLAKLETMKDQDKLTSDYIRRVREVKSAIRRADQAVQQLVEHHLEATARLVLSHCRNWGIPMMDLIQDANIALIEAAHLWDNSTEGGCFWFYAQAGICGQLNSSYHRSKPIHISEEMARAIQKIYKVRNLMSRLTGGNISEKAVAREMNLSPVVVRDILKHRPSDQIYSLEAPASPDDDTPLLNFVEGGQNPADVIMTSMLCETVDAVLKTIDLDEEKIIRLRFGFIDDTPHTQKEVAHVCGLSIQEELHIEAMAMRRLRHPSRSCRLVGFLD